MSKLGRSRHCFVPYCKSQYGTSSSEKVSLFYVPKDPARREQWARVIARTDRDITWKDAVCEKHFRPTDIIGEWVDSSGTMCVPFKHPRLAEMAVPSIFPQHPAVTNKRARKTRKIGKREIVKIPYDPAILKNLKRRRAVARLKESKRREVTIVDETPLVVTKVSKTYSATAGVLNKGADMTSDEYSENFDEIWNNTQNLSLPSPSWAVHSVENGRKQLVICECTISETKPLLLRQIVLEPNLMVKMFIQEKEIDSKVLEECSISTVVHDINDLNKLLDFFAKVSICFG